MKRIIYEIRATIALRLFSGAAFLCHWIAPQGSYMRIAIPKALYLFAEDQYKHMTGKSLERKTNDPT